MLTRQTATLSTQCYKSICRLNPNLFRKVVPFSTETNSKTKNGNEKVENEESQEIPSAAEQEITKLNETIADITDKYKRSLAETENVRSRLRKEIEDSKMYGIQSFCKDLITVADVMKMAVTSIPKDELSNKTGQVWKSFYEGVCLTDKELHKVFDQHGLKVLEPEYGEKFNPYDHEALFEVPIDTLEPGVIAHVERIGYKLKGRTLRPAQVSVSRKIS
uniref:GrpE protein homolog n=1 Tax=Ciona savignyi TaxID=51511 RepID=H2YTE7_CIOSA